MKQGAIPEFVPVRDLYEIFKIYTEANAKNKILLKSNENVRPEGPLPDDETLDLMNIKEDIILMQFKLVRKDTLKTWNTHSFINVPVSKMNDVNLLTLTEILNK